MKRREFIRKSSNAGIAATAIFSFGSIKESLAGNADDPYDLVAVRGGEPAEMLNAAMDKLGGMKSFVKPGQTVVLKPNISWDRTPDRAANTNPDLVKRVVEMCFEAGAKSVKVFDHTCHEWTKCYKNSGIEDALAVTKCDLLPGNSEVNYKMVQLEKGKRLKETKVHEALIDCDVFINIPILKNHSSAKVSVAMKNLMGCVWDRGYYHKNDLHQCIVDFVTYRKPDLNIVDAYKVMKENGPMGVSTDDVVDLGTLVVSKDIVAVDAAAAKFFGAEPSDIGHIKLAHEQGIGNMNLSELNIHRIKFESQAEKS